MNSVRVWGFSNETHHLQLLNQLSNPAFQFWASNSLTVFPNSKSECFSVITTAKKGPRLQPIHAAASEDGGRSSSGRNKRNEVVGAKGSGTSARGRRLLKVREEKRRREHDRLHNYPSWAKLVTLFFFLFWRELVTFFKCLSSMCLNYYLSECHLLSNYLYIMMQGP